MLQEHHRRKERHLHPKSSDKRNQSSSNKVDRELQKFYNKVMGNVYEWKGKREDFQKFINVCFPNEAPKERHVADAETLNGPGVTSSSTKSTPISEIQAEGRTKTDPVVPQTQPQSSNGAARVLNP